ncbi:MAG: hypothetical protein WCK70_14470 [Chloroflexales bacterium]
MATNRNTVRPKGAPGMKALVTTASLAATLAGWATLSINTPAAPVTAQVTLPVEVEQQATPVIVMAPPPAWLRQEPSIPNIPAVATVQPIGGEPALVAAHPHHITVPAVAAAPVAAAPAPAPAVAAPVAAPPAEAAPAPAAPAPAPELRSVAPPPAPTARPAAPPAPKPVAAPAPKPAAAKPAAPAKTKSSR